ncbi:putative F-box protein At5g50220 isoform X2 [Papaver somniferum]|uniref:putative F-box protein At5g50220 isoform X2 n=1 Tax=Papaver somniferum TaxID=3469 RepID=UPI000E6FA944|nr:putative F-box protein At5g50220 isoform X2 [Papaver somniferum]
MRFKCVSKHWLYLIEEDSFFIDLHLTRSKARPSLVYLISLPSVINQQFSEIRCKGQDEVFLKSDLSLEGIGRADIHTMRKIDMFCCDFILRPINGLMCFVDYHKHAVCIYNIRTREASPWIQSTLLLDEKEKHPETNALDYHVTSYKFGFDPTTREHKVLCMWYITVGEVDNCLQEDMDDVIEVWEIFTLGDGSWRRIPEVPPYLRDSLPCAYVNGSIYWCTDMFIRRENWSKPSCVVAFDFGTEKFREIQIPEVIWDQPLDPDKSFNGYIRLVELDGRLGILRRINPFISKLWIFDDQRYGNEKVNKTKSASGEIWIDETITSPFPWTKTLSLNVYPMVGTRQMVLQTYQGAARYMNNVLFILTIGKKKLLQRLLPAGLPFQFQMLALSKCLLLLLKALCQFRGRVECMMVYPLQKWNF